LNRKVKIIAVGYYNNILTTLHFRVEIKKLGGIMNKLDKKLAKKVLARFNFSDPGSSFTRDENLILERWRTLKIINEDAFTDVSALQDDHKEYLQVPGYPFTKLGEEEIKKSGYMHFRESKGITILRDALTVFAFLVSLILAISKLIQQYPPT
jgi:hypothetical protein